MKKSPLPCLNTAEDLQQWRKSNSDSGAPFLVPTMGALHEGHLALVRRARKLAGKRPVVVSIFVNPKQFAAGEDLERYPQLIDSDLKLLKDLGDDAPDAVFAPSAEAIYPDGFTTTISPGALGDILCGHSRPKHFDGVCTVVAILFRMTACTDAIFGEKDYQQAQIIKAMSRDLQLDVEIHTAPTVRESDGLAMSSRNQFLSDEQRQQAAGLYATLQEVQRRVQGGKTNAAALRAWAEEELQSDSIKVDYVSIVDAHSLEQVKRAKPGDVCAVSAFLGTTRLIDNLRL